MKILIVMAGFFPGKKYGGPPVSINNLCSLMSEHEFYIITRNHDLGETETYEEINVGWNNRGNCKILYLSDNYYKYSTFGKLIKKIKPDFLYLQGLFQKCVFPCLILSKKYKTKVVLAPRGELCEGAFKKKYKKMPYIYILKKFKLLENAVIQSTSKDESEAVEKYLGVPSKKIYQLPNIPTISSINIFPLEKKTGELRITYLSRIVPKKNLLFALRCMQYIKGRVVFDIYGPIEDQIYWDECKNMMKSLPHNIKVQYKGLVSHEVVYKTLCKYHLFFFPTLSENYGHAIAEAIISGCLVLISDQTPWNDLNSSGCGKAFSLNDMNKFVQFIQNCVNYNNLDFNKFRLKNNEYKQRKFRIKELKKIYTDFFNSICNTENISQ